MADLKNPLLRVFLGLFSAGCWLHSEFRTFLQQPFGHHRLTIATFSGLAI